MKKTAKKNTKKAKPEKKVIPENPYEHLNHIAEVNIKFYGQGKISGTLKTNSDDYFPYLFEIVGGIETFKQKMIDEKKPLNFTNHNKLNK